MNKIHKGLRALKLVLRHPWLLNNVLDDEEVCKERFCRKYAMPDGLPLLHLNTLFPDFAHYGLRRYVLSEVPDAVSVIFQDRDHDILADIMDISLDRCHDQRAAFRAFLAFFQQ